MVGVVLPHMRRIITGYVAIRTAIVLGWESENRAAVCDGGAGPIQSAVCFDSGTQPLRWLCCTRWTR